MRPIFTAALFLLFTVLVMSWRDSIPVQTYLVQTELPQDRFMQEVRRGLSEVEIKVIYKDLGIYKVKTRTSHTEATKRFDDWKRSGVCLHSHADRRISVRSTPDDPLWSDQWGHRRIEAHNIWQETTGGLSSEGDTIVVAVLDAGFNLEHVDLKANLWHNYGEIPGDGIDNDQNGYVDDFTGLNIDTGNDDHSIDIHGSEVAGIIGAVGDNNTGIAGINWDIKILPISGINFESDVIEGYNYIKQWREEYNASGGNDGAFVVVTNMSAGINGGWAHDYPMWCAVYDDLGNAGILSTSAVTNRESQIDVEGDMPTTCDSEFLITVTNTDMDDRKFSPAGFGKVHVDLGAPGTPTLSTGLGNEYSTFGSTSAAAPHVAGTIALLYSANCDLFMDVVRTDPAGASLRLRDLILNSVDKNTALADKTASGGRLNAASAYEGLCDAFDDRPEQLAISRIYPNPSNGEATIDIQSPVLDGHLLRIFDSTGRLVYERQISPESNIFSEEITISAGPGVFYVRLEAGDYKTSHTFVVI